MESIVPFTRALRLGCHGDAVTHPIRHLCRGLVGVVLQTYVAVDIFPLTRVGNREKQQKFYLYAALAASS